MEGSALGPTPLEGIPKLVPVPSGGQRLFCFYQHWDFCSKLQPNIPYSISVSTFSQQHFQNDDKTGSSVNRCPLLWERDAARCQNPRPSHISGIKAYVWGWLQKGRTARLGSYFPRLLCSSVHFDFQAVPNSAKLKQTTEAPLAKDQPRFRNAVVVQRQ